MTLKWIKGTNDGPEPNALRTASTEINMTCMEGLIRQNLRISIRAIISENVHVGVGFAKNAPMPYVTNVVKENIQQK